METVTQPEITIVGPSIVTSNKNGQAMQDTKAFCGKYFAEGIADKIENRTTPGTTYAVYYKYTDTTAGQQDYRMIIGEAVTDNSNANAEFESVVLPAQQYVKVEAAGKVYEAVPAAWHMIWSNKFTYNRTNIADYEVYDARVKSPEDGIVDIFVGIR